MQGLLPILQACRALIGSATPLQDDCGRLCGCACCQSLPGDETGMLLFPGEEEFYRNLPGWQVKPCETGLMVICPGACRRDERPLACMLFPLLPLLREDGIKVAMDARSRAVCPLARWGVSGLRQDFAASVRACGELLSRDATQRAFLLRLTEQHDELKALQSTFGGRNAHV